jgi:hypothetical protein
MAPEQPYDPNPRRVTSSRVLPTAPGPARPAPTAGNPLADQLVTYLERLTIADGHVRQVRDAYTDRIRDTAPARRPEPTPERITDPDTGRDR